MGVFVEGLVYFMVGEFFYNGVIGGFNVIFDCFGNVY